jgi:hypothetical protein
LQRIYDEKSASGILYMNLTGNGKHQYDVRLNHRMPQEYASTGLRSEVGFFRLIILLVLLIPFLQYTKGRQMITILQESRNKHVVVHFWAVSCLSHIFNMYMTIKILVVTCYPYRIAYYTTPACETAGIGVGYILFTSGIVSIMHCKHFTLPIPTLMQCAIICGHNNTLKRFIRVVSLWGIHYSITSLSLCLPFQVLLVGTNPLLYGFTILTVWCVMFTCITITSIPFTIAQAFISEVEYRITLKEAIHHILLLAFVAVLFLGFGSLAFGITLILHLSKNGERTVSVSASLLVVLRYTLLPVLAWMVQVIYRRIQSSLTLHCLL